MEIFGLCVCVCARQIEQKANRVTSKLAEGWVKKGVIGVEERASERTEVGRQKAVKQEVAKGRSKDAISLPRW